MSNDADQQSTAYPTDAEITKARDELLLSLALATLAVMPQTHPGQFAAFDNLSQRTGAWLDQMTLRYPRPANVENL